MYTMCGTFAMIELQTQIASFICMHCLCCFSTSFIMQIRLWHKEGAQIGFLSGEIVLICSVHAWL